MGTAIAKTVKLDQLAAKINTSISHIKDNMIETAKLLAQAKGQCRAEGITFKDWVVDNLALSYNRACILARAAETGDAPKAIEDLREFERDRNKKRRAVSGPDTGSLAEEMAAAETWELQSPCGTPLSHKKADGTVWTGGPGDPDSRRLDNAPDDDEDEDEGDDASMKRRGLLACCEQAKVAARDAERNLKWLVEHRPELIDEEATTAIWDAYQFWGRVDRMPTEKRGATLPQDGRSEVAVDDPAAKRSAIIANTIDAALRGFPEMPPELDRRRKA